MNEYERAQRILKNIGYATVATVTSDGKPWNTPVKHEIDDDLNIYWFSDKKNVHSKNVRSRGEVFIVIYDSTVPEGQGEGVYFEADAYELSDAKEVLKARQLKKGPGEHSPNDFLGESIRRVYKAVPKRAWINDAEITNGVFIRDFRKEVALDELRSKFF